MKIAVLSLTRDRLPTTKACFATLRETAGCAYDHFVLDQGSTDGTPEWLLREWTRSDMPQPILLSENIGISAGMNWLLDRIDGLAYDVIVKVDNDCEIATPNTLLDVCKLVDEYGLLLSPQIHGLRHPPSTLGTPLALGPVLVDEKAQIGGVFLAAPASLYDDFRYSTTNPFWGRDDEEICAYWRSKGQRCGYVQGIDAFHRTDDQQAADPGYFERKYSEMAA